MQLSRKSISFLTLLAMGVAAVGCSSGGDDIAGSDPRTDIDPRSYYDDYSSDSDHDMSSNAAPEAGMAEDEASAAGDGGAVEDVGPIEPGEVEEPDFLDDNTFVDPGDTSFVSTADDPLSTFGFDVDTGSFQVGRTFLDEGHLPEPESVRTEEWVNAFDYGYDPPEATGELAVQVDSAPSPVEEGTDIVRVGTQAAVVDPEERPDAAITLVVDTSGSMDIRERLGLVRSTLALFAVHLRAADTVAVVTFEDEATTLLPPTQVSEVDTILAAIDDLQPAGSTNLEAGLRRGYDLAAEAFRPDAINTVILASDGVANVGTTGVDDLGDLAREKADEGIRLVTVGYGMGNYHDDRMEQLANRGDGFYSYVDTYEEAERLFSDELTSTLTIVAAEARAQVDFDPAAVEEYRLLGYENRVLADESFRDDDEDTGDLGAGHTVTAVYEVRRTEDGPDELGEVTVRHQPANVGGVFGEAVEQTIPITLEGTAPSFDDAPTNLRLAATVAAFAELLADSPVATDRDVTLDQLEDLATGLDSEDLGDGSGATPEDLVDMIDLARNTSE